MYQVVENGKVRTVTKEEIVQLNIAHKEVNVFIFDGKPMDVLSLPMNMKKLVDRLNGFLPIGG